MTSSSSIVTGLLLCVVGFLLLDHPVLDRETRSFLRISCRRSHKDQDCPGGCGEHGQCLNGICSCTESFHGPNCLFDHCPGNCSGNGVCIRGFCICQPQYGGANCSIDRLFLLRDALTEGVDFNLPYDGGACDFLTAEDIKRHGGDRTKYWSEVTRHTETYLVPENMLDVLPEKCPEHRFRSCAIVGNSGNLRFAKKGPEIDSHEMVYRFNQAPTIGYEDFVGKKTTFESLNAKFAQRLKDEEAAWLWREPPAIFVMFEPFKLRSTYVSIRESYPRTTALMFSPEFFSRAHHIYDQLLVNLERHEFGCFTGEKPMSGFYSILYALSACDSVDLYGFDAWVDNMGKMYKQRLRYHYFNSEEPRPGAHSFDATYFMYQLLAMRKNSTLRIHSIDVPQENEESDDHAAYNSQSALRIVDNESEDLEEDEIR